MKFYFCLFMALLAPLTLTSAETVHEVTRGDNLFRLALKYNTTVEDIKRLNNLKENTINPGQHLYIKTDESQLKTYTVIKGDTYASVAQKHGITEKMLLQVNRRSRETSLKQGEKLRLPAEPHITEYTVEKGDTLSWISMVFNTSAEEIRERNNLTGNNLSVGETLTFAPRKKEVQIRAASVSLPSVTREPVSEIHTVQKGETLSHISWVYDISQEELLKANNMINTDLQRGQKLIIPRKKRPEQPQTAEESVPVHTVARGETLSHLSWKYGVSQKEIQNLNKLTDTHLSVGQKLKIPVKKAEAPVTDSNTLHRVSKGETLSHISLKYGVTQQEIQNLNNLEDSNLSVGQELKIPVAKTETSEPVTDNSLLHRVSKGETLSHISLKYGVSQNEIQNLNNLPDSHLSVGQELKIPAKALIPLPEVRETGTLHTVKPGETLSQIALKYSVSINEIQEFNTLTGSALRAGQTLKIPSNGNTEKVAESKKEYSRYHIVEAGDTVSHIALIYGIPQEEISKINGISQGKIRIGQKILLPEIEKRPYKNYTVMQGDTLSAISLRLDISETLLKEINHLADDRIQAGQVLNIPPSEKRTHRVAEGETLWAIAMEYGVTVDQLMLYNSLNTTILPAGKVLNIYDYQIAELKEETPLSPAPRPSVHLVSMEYKNNRTQSQPYKNYSEDKLHSSYSKYTSAVKLWTGFENKIKAAPPLSNALDGWYIVLDPGHGGKDPGAIASVTNSNGKKVYIVEDEYAYDVTLRLYELLVRHGAEVELTVLSPNHLTRNTGSSGQTFVNEKNEVYNDQNLNKINKRTIWPVGGRWGLGKRVEIANRFFKNRKKTMFISIHGDNDPERGPGKLVIYDYRNGVEDVKSKTFALDLLKEMNNQGVSGKMPLAVLYRNNALVKVLVEVRNLAHASEAQAIRDDALRQKDAEMITRGILRYTEKL